MKSQFEQSELERMTSDPDNYKWFLFYYNTKDSRIFVPKMSPWMGWTLNFGNIFSYLIIIGIVLITIFFKYFY